MTLTNLTMQEILVETFTIADVDVKAASDGKINETLVVNVIGYYDEDTPSYMFEWYDFFVDGECINEGSPFYGDPPDDTDVLNALQIHYADVNA